MNFGGAKTSVTCSELWDGWGTHHVVVPKTSVTCSELWDGWGTHHVVVPKPVLPAVNYEMAGAHTMWWCQNHSYLQWTMRWLGHTPCGGAKTSVTCSELRDGWGTHHVVVPKPVLPAVNYEMAGAHTMWWCQNQFYLQWTMRWLEHTPCGGAKTSVTCSELWDGWGTHHVVVPKPVLPAVNYEMAGAHTMW